MKKLLLSCATLALVAGCAAPQTDADPAAPRADREYPTGSNIPRKKPAGAGDGVQVYDRDAVERLRNQVPQMPARGGSP